MEAFPVLLAYGSPSRSAGVGIPAISRAARPCVGVASGNSCNFLWHISTTAPWQPVLQLIGPNDQAENAEEDEEDLELESDEDPTKLRWARALPGPEEGGTAARGGDGTINPPFP